MREPFKEDLSVGLGDTLELILLLDGVAVGGALKTNSNLYFNPLIVLKASYKVKGRCRHKNKRKTK